MMQGQVLQVRRTRKWPSQVQVERCWPRQEVGLTRLGEQRREIKEKMSGQAVRVVEKFHVCTMESTSVVSKSADEEGRKGGRATGVVRCNLSNS